MTNDITVTVKKLRPGAWEPAYATPGAAAMDLCALLEAPVKIPPGGRTAIPTGLAIALPSEAYVALVFGRSGMGFAYGVTLSNAVGVIDADYRGEIAVGLVNHGEMPYTVRSGDRIAQLAVLPVCHASVVWAEELPPTARGQGGFGSTGR
ncbi:MAG: dUTP diphosphatase [Oscillospiraceae bacterium]|jgi:dUTP pyrophosphatase|nr:dUTP diphosphatase [Oscillospiraceae bacterium]